MGAVRPKVVIECEREFSRGEVKFVVISYTSTEGKMETREFQSLQEAERFLNKEFRSQRIRREYLKEAEIVVITSSGDFKCRATITFEPSPPRPRLRPR